MLILMSILSLMLCLSVLAFVCTHCKQIVLACKILACDVKSRLACKKETTEEEIVAEGAFMIVKDNSIKIHALVLDEFIVLKIMDEVMRRSEEGCDPELQWTEVICKISVELEMSEKIFCGTTTIFFTYTYGNSLYVRTFFKDDGTEDAITIEKPAQQAGMRYIDKAASAFLLCNDEKLCDCTDWLTMFAGPLYDFHRDIIKVATFFQFCCVKDANVSLPPTTLSIMKRNGDIIHLSQDDTLADFMTCTRIIE